MKWISFPQGEETIEDNWNIPDDKEKSHIFLLINPDPGKVARVKKIKGILRSLPEKVEHTAFVDSNELDYCDRPKCTHFNKESFTRRDRKAPVS